jgi:glycerol-3-phosphate dehydrogenase
MAGGKLTTYRKMAEQLLDGLIDRTPEWRGKTAPCVTKHLDLAHPMPATSASLGALVRPWLEEEPLMTLSDLLDRRLQYLFLEPDHGLRHIEEAQRILAGHYGFTAEESERQRKEYLELVHRSEAGLNRQPHSPAL